MTKVDLHELLVKAVDEYHIKLKTLNICSKVPLDLLKDIYQNEKYDSIEMDLLLILCQVVLNNPLADKYSYLMGCIKALNNVGIDLDTLTVYSNLDIYRIEKIIQNKNLI